MFSDLLKDFFQKKLVLTNNKKTLQSKVYIKYKSSNNF